MCVEGSVIYMRMCAVFMCVCVWKLVGVDWEIIIIMIIIIALKGAVQDSPHCAANCLRHVRSSTPGTIACKSCATHRALITCNMLCATCYEGTAQLFSLTESKSYLR